MDEKMALYIGFAIIDSSPKLYKSRIRIIANQCGNASSQRDSIRCSLFAHAIFGWDDLCSKGGRTVELFSLSCSFALLRAVLLNGGLRGCSQGASGRERDTQ